MEDLHKEFEQSKRNYVKETEILKNELMAVSEDKANLQKELEEATKKQLELLEQLKFQSDSEDNVKELQEEIEKIKSAFEEQILNLQKQLEAATNEKELEIIHLQEVIEANSQHYQKDINNLQEELLQLKSTHQEELKDLMCQNRVSHEEHKVVHGDHLVKQCEESEERNIQEKNECELENLGDSTANQENQLCSLLLQGDEQEVNNKIRLLEDTLKELESQHSILKDELTYMTNLKLKLEIDAQQIKNDFFHEREDLEFKINELLLSKEEQGCVIERLKSQLEDSNKQFCHTVEQHNKEIEHLKEEHRKEMSELNETFLSDSEKEKLALMFEIRGFKEQCEHLQQEKQEAILNYESLREMMEILQTELGESAGKISQEFESMKQQQASDVSELQQKLRTAFNEKDALLETVNRLQKENEKLSQQEFVPELENVIKDLQGKNEVYLVSLSQRDTMLKEFEAKISSLTEEKDDFISKMESSLVEIDDLHKKCEREERLNLELREKVEQTTQYNSELERKINELMEKHEDKDQNNQKVDELMMQLKILSEDKAVLSSEKKFLSEEINRLSSEEDQLNKDLAALLSQISELEKKLELAVEQRDNLNKLFENEKLLIKAQLDEFLKQMKLKVPEENEEQDVASVLEAIGESLAKLSEEKKNLAFQYDKRILELEEKIKCLEEENVVQCEELRSSSLRDYEQEKVLRRKELEEILSEKEILQSELLEMKNANDKTGLVNQELSFQFADVPEKLCRENENNEKEEALMKELENLKPLLEQKENELQDVRAELILLKVLLI